jgi:membrane-bound metal-dependent hydrolase YbcI (DUF457 family)
LTFAIGHFALCYLTGKASSKLLKVKLNLPLLFAISVLPDVDLILQFANPTLFMHRGLTHAIITATMLMIPFFLKYKKQAIPYYVTLLSHLIIGDFFTGGLELFWPLSQNWFSASSIDVVNIANIALEFTLFVVVLPIMFKTKDIQTLLKPIKHKWALIIALGAVIGPLLQIGTSSEMYLPTLLMIPSIFYVCLFGYSLILDLQLKLQRKKPGSVPQAEHPT